MAAVNSITMETKTFVDEYDFIWKIHNLLKQNKEIESAMFSPLSNMDTPFSVSLQFNRRGFPPSSYLTCVINLKKFTTNNEILKYLNVKAGLEFTKPQGSEVKKISINSLLDSIDFEDDKLQIGRLSVSSSNNRWRVFFDEEKTESDDTLILKIHFEFSGHKVLTKSIAPFLMNTPHQNLSILSSDYRNLYNSKSLTDIKIQIDGTVLQAHQTVLVARSPVFKRMLESSYLESGSKCLTIIDIDSDIFDCFLKYLYFGVVEDKTFSTACRLYFVAYKYEVSSLQEELAGILASNLNSENVCTVLELSYLHSDNALKDKAVSFISSCFNEIKPKPEWDEMIKKYPELTSEVLGSIIASWKN